MLAAKTAIAEVVRPPYPIHLTPAQRDALVSLGTVNLDRAVHRQAHKTLQPILAPIHEAGRHDSIGAGSAA
jgi:hypothetical protein